uniref:Uncharacterized protein n=1 Tax=Moschus moschiferus TaxID=68415 RepID=A0A8C6DGH9_MOSMO
MNIENIMLSERSQAQKTTSCRLLFIGNVQNSESMLEVARGWREGVKGVSVNEYGISLWSDENILELDSGDHDTTL